MNRQLHICLSIYNSTLLVENTKYLFKALVLIPCSMTRAFEASPSRVCLCGYRCCIDGISLPPTGRCQCKFCKMGEKWLHSSKHILPLLITREAAVFTVAFGVHLLRSVIRLYCAKLTFLCTLPLKRIAVIPPHNFQVRVLLNELVRALFHSF